MKSREEDLNEGMRLKGGIRCYTAAPSIIYTKPVGMKPAIIVLGGGGEGFPLIAT